MRLAAQHAARAFSAAHGGAGIQAAQIGLDAHTVAVVLGNTWAATPPSDHHGPSSTSFPVIIQLGCLQAPPPP